MGKRWGQGLGSARGRTRHITRNVDARNLSSETQVSVWNEWNVENGAYMPTGEIHMAWLRAAAESVEARAMPRLSGMTRVGVELTKPPTSPPYNQQKRKGVGKIKGTCGLQKARGGREQNPRKERKCDVAPHKERKRHKERRGRGCTHVATVLVRAMAMRPARRAEPTTLRANRTVAATATIVSSILYVTGLEPTARGWLDAFPELQRATPRRASSFAFALLGPNNSPKLGSIRVVMVVWAMVWPDQGVAWKKEWPNHLDLFCGAHHHLPFLSFCSTHTLPKFSTSVLLAYSCQRLIGLVVKARRCLTGQVL